MAITLRNKQVENDIREIGKRTGEGPSAVIARAIGAEKVRLFAENECETEREIEEMLMLLEALPKPTAAERAAVRRVMEELYDENGLPK